MLVEHQLEVISQEPDLVGLSGDVVGVFAANRARDALENPGVEQRPASDGDRIAPGDLAHFQNLLRSADISIADDRNSFLSPTPSAASVGAGLRSGSRYSPAIRLVATAGCPHVISSHGQTM